MGKKYWHFIAMVWLISAAVKFFTDGYGDPVLIRLALAVANLAMAEAQHE